MTEKHENKSLTRRDFLETAGLATGALVTGGAVAPPAIGVVGVAGGRDNVAELGRAAANDLRAVMRGRVITPGDDGYDSSRRVENCAVDHRPALVAVCRDAEDVRAAVRAARAHGLALSVRGGGHDWVGRAVRDAGLVVDLRAMRRVTVDPANRVATVAGGATATDLIAAAAPHQLAAVTGTSGSVGMVGLTLAGGYGPLSSRFGLALDNMLGAEVVLADGRLVTANTAENPDLFWALRGGGGNFGVVTAIQFRLHPLPSLLAGQFLFPVSQAASVLRGYADMLDSAPDELAVMANLVSDPSGRPVLSLSSIWTGDPLEGDRGMIGLRRLGKPLLERVNTMTYAELLGRLDAQLVRGRNNETQTRWLPELTPKAIATLVEAGGHPTSPESVILMQSFRGAAARVAPADTAFGLRRDHFLVVIAGVWKPSAEDDGSRHRRWAHDLSRNLAPAALPGGYPNLLAPQDHEQIAQAYGGNAGRLRDVKRRYDPDHVFTATPLPLGE